MKSILATFLLTLVACSTNTSPTPSPARTIDASVPSISIVHPIDTDVPPALTSPPTADTRSLQQIAQAACGSRCRGTLVRPTVAASGSTPITPPSWTIQDWYFDPANSIACASDSNSGTSATCTGGCAGSVCTSGIGPTLTINEIFSHRLGTQSPTYPYGQPVRFHQLSTQSLGVDSYFFTPNMSGGGYAVLIGTPTVLHTQAAGAVTARNRASGVLLQIAGMPGGTTAGQLVFNTTRNSYAFIDSMASTTATMQQPVAASVINTIGIPAVSTEAGEDNTWTTGDAISIQQLPGSNEKLWAPISGDVSPGGQVSAGWVQFIHVLDSSTSNISSLPVLGYVCNVMSACQIDTRISAGDLTGRGGIFLIGDTVAGRFTAQSGTVQAFAGGYAAGISVIGGNFALNGDAVTHEGMQITGVRSEVQSFYNDSGLTSTQIGIDSGEVSSVTAGSAIWGPANLALGPGGAFEVTQNPGNDFTDALLVTGTISFAALTVGWTPQGADTQGGAFTLNGVTQVAVTGTFPASAPITISLKTVGSTPGTSAPYFSQAQTGGVSGQFFVKSPTAGANDVYNWQAMPTPVALTPANMSTFHGLQDPASGARFCITN